MPAIQLKDAAILYKSGRRRAAAVLSADLTIRQGEFVFLVGSSGSGKSTLLKLVTGEISPDKGAVFLGNVDLSRPSPGQRKLVRRSFGKVWQESRLVRGKTVAENFRIDPWTGGRDRRLFDGELVEKALGIVGMAGTGGRYPAELSIAECRKVELARAILRSPPILVLDELTDRLDNDSIWDIAHLLDELNRQGTTVIMSTHAGQIVNIMCRRVITLVDGKVRGDVERGRFGDISGRRYYRFK